MPHPADADQDWAGYLDALTAAAHAVLDGPAGTADGPPPVFPALDQPGTPLPAALEARRDGVMQLLARTTREVERRRSEVAQEISELRPRAPRSPYRTEVGGAVDVVG
jgi:hypothetical protein